MVVRFGRKVLCEAISYALYFPYWRCEDGVVTPRYMREPLMTWIKELQWARELERLEKERNEPLIILASPFHVM